MLVDKFMWDFLISGKNSFFLDRNSNQGYNVFGGECLTVYWF